MLKKQPGENKRLINGLALSCLLSFIALSIVFIGGIFNSKTYIEKVAAYASSVVRNNTYDGRYCCISVDKKTKTGLLPAADNELFNLYGVFKKKEKTKS